MMSSIVFKNILIALIPIILLATSCSGTTPEKKATNAPAKVLKVKNTVPACCSKKPSRFSPNTKQLFK